MGKFYNPYHFVPVEPRGPAHEYHSVARSEFEDRIAGKEAPGEKFGHVTHERYVPGTHSGRLVARLTTVTPTAIGSKRETDKRTQQPRVHSFKVEDKPAIPASTLRGLVGSIIEAATNGPLRILEDRAYSYRKKMEGESLSAIGLLVGDANALKLKPMCLPTLDSRDWGKSFAAPPRFRRIFPGGPQFKVYFGDSAQIRDDAFGYRTHTSVAQAVDMPVKQLVWAGNAVASDNSLHVKANRSAVAQDADSNEKPRPGMVRVLGCWGDRREQMPHSKKHELWIPLPDAKAPALAIAPEALERFEQLADERTERDPTLPFEPKDTRPNRAAKGEGARLRLQPGDMVYFDVDEKGMVTEISFSAIWRGRVENQATHEAASAFAFFDSEMRPFHPGRKTVSIAEQMLGFAEEVPASVDREERALAFASRLRFADALLQEGAPGRFEAPVTLRILDAPKCPCPALYFRGKDGRGQYIAKRGLDPQLHTTQGRKWYLHARPQGNARPWATGNQREGLKQKSIVEPASAGQEFFFHVDFDNLNDVELGLVLLALEPDPQYHHKVGMGKPLGLGSVKIEVLGYFPVNRQRRYSLEGLREERLSSTELTAVGAALRGRAEWPARYGAEGAAAVGEAGPCALAAARDAAASSGLVTPTVEKALGLLGDFAAAPLAGEVRYPTNADQRDQETEHYRWFVFNGGHKERRMGKSPSGQFLKPLALEKGLPGLVELE